MVKIFLNLQFVRHVRALAWLYNGFQLWRCLCIALEEKSFHIVSKYQLRAGCTDCTCLSLKCLFPTQLHNLGLCFLLPSFACQIVFAVFAIYCSRRTRNLSIACLLNSYHQCSVILETQKFSVFCFPLLLTCWLIRSPSTWFFCRSGGHISWVHPFNWKCISYFTCSCFFLAQFLSSWYLNSLFYYCNVSNLFQLEWEKSLFCDTVSC